jgi:hypothetical protein
MVSRAQPPRAEGNLRRDVPAGGHAVLDPRAGAGSYHEPSRRAVSDDDRALGRVPAWEGWHADGHGGAFTFLPQSPGGGLIPSHPPYSRQAIFIARDSAAERRAARRAMPRPSRRRSPSTASASSSARLAFSCAASRRCTTATPACRSRRRSSSGRRTTSA